MRVLVVHTRPLPDQPNEPVTAWALGPGGQIIGPPDAAMLEGRVWVLGFTPNPELPFLGDGFVPFRQFWANPTHVTGMQAVVASPTALAVCPDTVVDVIETDATAPTVQS